MLFATANHEKSVMKAKQVFLHFTKWLGLFALCRSLTRNSPRIICYHGGSLGDEHLFNPKLFCRPGHIEHRLRWLDRKGFVPCRLDALLDEKKSRPNKGIPVIVTVDDGWYSSSSNLLPVLLRHGHRPVLYLATKLFGVGGPVPDVCVAYIVWKSPLVSVSISGIDPLLDGVYSLDQHEGSAQLKDAAGRWLAAIECDAGAIISALELFAKALDVPAAALDLASRRFSYVTREELLGMACDGCQVELHGHEHRYVPGRPELNRIDIESCRDQILALGLPAPRHYCYPSGKHDADAPATLTALGVSTATTCVSGLVRSASGDCRFFLPRFLDGGDVSMIEFEAEMSGVLDFLRRLIGKSPRLAR